MSLPKTSDVQALNQALASIKGSPNLRDLASVDPKRLRPNMVYRGTQLVNSIIAEELNLRSFIDLRRLASQPIIDPLPEQMTRVQAPLLSDGAAMELVQSLSFCCKLNLMCPCFSWLLCCLPSFSDVIEHQITKSPEATGDFYMLTIDHASDEITDIFEFLVDAVAADVAVTITPSGDADVSKDEVIDVSRTLPTLIHCAQGKDRTGIVAALLLKLCGVEHWRIVQDYAVSHTNLVQARADGLLGDPSQILDKHLVTPHGAMEQMLSLFDSYYESVDEYLEADLGFTSQEIWSVKSLLMLKPGKEPLTTAATLLHPVPSVITKTRQEKRDAVRSAARSTRSSRSTR